MKNVMFVFWNDFFEVEGNKDIFMKMFIEDLILKFLYVKIDNVRFVWGSILVYFDIMV